MAKNESLPIDNQLQHELTEQVQDPDDMANKIKSNHNLRRLKKIDSAKQIAEKRVGILISNYEQHFQHN